MEALEVPNRSEGQGRSAWFLLAVVVVAFVALLLLALTSYADGGFRAAPAPGPSPTTNQERVVELSRSGGVTDDMATDSQILVVAQASCRSKADTGGDLKQMASATRQAVAEQGITGLDADLVGGIVGGAAAVALCPDADS